VRVCTNCLHHDDRKIEHCPSCGSYELAELNGKGFVIAVPAGAGLPCQGCFETGRSLKLRYFRRVVGMLLADRIHATLGFFCGSCRRRQFGTHMVLTLLLGWWGIVALFLRNPYAIVTNLWALFAPPFGTGQLGAMNIHEIRAEARQQHRLAHFPIQDRLAHVYRRHRLAHVYMTMPWFDRIDEDEMELTDIGAPPPDLAELTTRELHVLRLIAEGRSNGQIAAALLLSESTIETHVNKILTKLRLRDRVQAVALAYRSGLMEPHS
jgi:DNA-binding CsgD family transcriptional regulator